MTSLKGAAAFAVYGLTAAAVWLAWEMIKTPVAERAPPATAALVAPTSPEVLRRAAEHELIEGRIENARSLASDSLARAPFNARTLRVLGLSAAREGRIDQADEMLTLAGNWSLRDDPAHAWLIDRRLRQGNYGSAFAHADTLARRWAEGSDRLFDLFASAVLNDQRALPALATAMARRPPWRAAFIQYLIARPDADAVLLSLGLALAENPNGYSTQELSWIYQSWYSENRLQAIRALRAGVGRPGRLDGLQNGDFTDTAEKTLLPFGWELDPTPGISANLVEDDVRANEIALRVEYDGYASGTVTEQVLMVQPGSYVLSGMERVEITPDSSRLRWRILCVESNQTISFEPVRPATSDTATWGQFDFPFVVPSSGCSVQRLRLEADPGGRRDTTIVWFDKLKIASAGSGR